jgi:hypothetical protein
VSWRREARPAAEQIRHPNREWLYADPLDSRCVYFGAQKSWAAYRQDDRADEPERVGMEPWGWP